MLKGCRIVRGSTLLAALLAGAISPPGRAGEQPGRAALRFEKDILPILKQHCVKCHGSQSKRAGLDLTTAPKLLAGSRSGPVLVKGSADKSVLFDKVASRTMPPPEKKDALSDREIATLRKWIDSGAAGAEAIIQTASAEPPTVSDQERAFWAFRKPVASPVPALKSTKRVRTPVDAFLLARLEARGLTFSPDAARTTLIRRAYLDLIGLPPSPDEVRAFLASSEPDAYERLIDRLLDSPHYGERWGRHWLDVAGYTDAPHTDMNDRSLSVADWLYRDYVVRSLNQDKPYDRFLTEQLAGDEIVDWRTAGKYTPEILDDLIATGYLRTTPDYTNVDMSGGRLRYCYDTAARVVENVATGVLGLTMGCVRCHTHKFEPIPHQDYYRLMAVFTTAYNFDDWLRPAQRCLPAVPKAEQDEIDRFNAQIDAQVAHRQKELDKLRRLAPERLAAAQKARQAALESEIANLNKSRRTYTRIQALWDVGKPPAVHQLLRGSADTPGPVVEPGFVTVLCPTGRSGIVRPPDVKGESSGRRLAFAHWLTSRDQPLTARVLVNRVWEHHFGKGIVATPENFGHSGSPPTHPELLDALAIDFMDHGWSIKRLHRLLMTSTAYRQSAHWPADAPGLAADPDNDLLWHMNLRRLEAEALRDAVLAVSGKLDLTMGGSPVPIETHPDGLVTISDKGSAPTSKWRRSLYVYSPRGSRGLMLSFFEVFDFPDMAINCTGRINSTTPLQSLTLINSAFMLEQANHFAQRARVLAASDAPAKQVQAAVLLALGREPTPSELQSCLKYLQTQRERYLQLKEPPDRAAQHALAGLCSIFLASSEFLYIG
jgi:mono/diheme cytochrome c family protein